jgi:hypothetical protein
MMKSHFAIVLTGLAPFAALAIPALLIALEQSGLQMPQNHHAHYKVIDAGNLGVPNVTTNSDWSTAQGT